MKLKIFAVRDRKTDQYGTPMFMVSDGQAIRGFGDEVNREAAENQLWAHAEDFSLHALGSWDSDTGEFEAGRPAQIALGDQLKVGK